MIQLAQNQLWKQGDRYFRIVIWERLAIQYKETNRADASEGTVHDVNEKRILPPYQRGRTCRGKPEPEEPA